jgi:DNA (cytosine-5)-methyltransferase 1
MEARGKIIGLDLFSGIGGVTIALQRWVTPIAYCENDRYAQGVLLSRMFEGKIPIAPIWDDVSTLRGEALPVRPDIIYGGFPCQDISVANTIGRGLEGKRSGLFFEIMRLSNEIKPRFIFLENVPNIRSKGLATVTEQLAEAGYDCRWGMLSASAVGAPHKRERWFLLAHALRERLQGRIPRWEGTEGADLKGLLRCCRTGISHRWPNGCGREQLDGDPPRFIESESSKSGLGRGAHGLRHRVDRIKCLGNAVVPQQAEEAFMRLIGLR